MNGARDLVGVELAGIERQTRELSAARAAIGAKIADLEARSRRPPAT